MDRKAQTDKVGRRRQKNGLTIRNHGEKRRRKKTRSPMRAWKEERRMHVSTYVLVTCFYSHTPSWSQICLCTCVGSSLPCSDSFNGGSFCRISRIIIIIIVTFGTKTRSWELKKRWCFQFFVIVIRKGRTETLERQADKHRERENLSIRLQFMN